ncbi:MAG: PAS domain-containing sensor histidine kinase [Pseudomonadales bacterium]|nr:PAS domain-containing sensor histidine kinase [Pseudomonadales bacterium]
MNKIVNKILKFKQNENYQTIFNSLNDAIFIYDEDTGQILDVNKKMSELYGYSKKEALKIDVGTISSGVTPYDKKGAMEMVKIAISDKPQVFEWHSKKKDGELFWAEVSLSKANLDGTDRIIAVVRDITTRKSAQEDMSSITKEKGDCISIVAHQLKTPLGSMRWNSELLLQKIDDHSFSSESVELVKMNYRINLKILDLINDLLNVSRIDQNVLHSQLKRFSLIQLIEEIIEELDCEAKLKSLEINFRVNKNHRYFVEMDWHLIREALRNVISNAVKYSYKDKKVLISLNRKEKFFEIKVSNKGIGIPIHDNKFIFDRFFRAKNAIKQNMAGSGLGLFIAKSFIDHMDGNITYSSDEDEKTIFVVRIPVTTAN